MESEYRSSSSIHCVKRVIASLGCGYTVTARVLFLFFLFLAGTVVGCQGSLPLFSLRHCPHLFRWASTVVSLPEKMEVSLVASYHATFDVQKQQTETTDWSKRLSSNATEELCLDSAMSTRDTLIQVG